MNEILRQGFFFTTVATSSNVLGWLTRLDISHKFKVECLSSGVHELYAVVRREKIFQQVGSSVDLLL